MGRQKATYINFRKENKCQLQGIVDGSLYNGYPYAIDRRLVISVKMKYEPNEDGLSFLGQIGQALEARGYGFEFAVLTDYKE
jgi:uncharacterized protein DUF6572